MVLYCCPRCAFFSPQFSRLIGHIESNHQHEEHFSLLCDVSGCSRSYSTVAAYASHVRRCHGRRGGSSNDEHLEEAEKEALEHPVSDTCCGPGDLGNMEMGDGDITGSERSDSSNMGSAELPFHEVLRKSRKEAFSFLCKFTEMHKVPHSVMNSLVDTVTVLIKSVMQAYGKQLQKVVRDGRSPEAEDELLRCDFVSHLFDGFRSQHQRQRYAEANLPYVAPQQHLLGEHGEHLQYVSVPAVLTNLCQTGGVAAHIFSSSSSSHNGDLSGYKGGELYSYFSTHILAEGTQFSILLVFYTDEIEIVNPLGPQRGKYKLLMVYYSVLNMHVRFRSQLRCVYLALIVRYAHVQTYGFEKVFQPLVYDLKLLANVGIFVRSPAFTGHVKAYVFCFCGDNLSSNKLGGFGCSFSSGKFCRFCLASHDMLQTLFRESQCTLRNAQAHDRHLVSNSIDTILSRRLYGVISTSVLLQLDYFDVTRQLPPDIMHDVLEGGIEHVVRQTLHGLTDDRILSSSDLEDIASFAFGRNDRKNKPEALSAQFLTGRAQMKGTASQKWCLFRFLPFIFGHKVPQNNRHWEVLLLYREIVDIIFGRMHTEETLAYLEVQIEHFLFEFTALYPGVSITPKLHFLVHYPRYIRLFGPLSQFWNMRFEAKHQYFKALSSKVKNFRNITKTLSVRHQLLQSCELLDPLSKGLSTKQAKAVSRQQLPECAQSQLEEWVYEVQEACLDTSNYSKDDVLVMQLNPVQFGTVEGLYVSSGRLSMYIKYLSLVGFDRHRFCYEVAESDVTALVKPGEEADCCALVLYSRSYIIPKWELSVL